MQTTKSKKRKDEVVPPEEEPKTKPKRFRALTFSKRKIGSNEGTGAVSRSCEAGQTGICLECTKQLTEKNAITTIQKEKKIEKKNEKVPLIQRLKIVSVTSSNNDKSRNSIGTMMARPLPREVVVIEGECTESDDSVSENNTMELYKECSELGFDGISTRSTMGKKVPARFTFDGIAPSASSGCESNAEGVAGSVGSEILDDLKKTEEVSLNDDASKPPKGLRSRRGTASSASELSIELSESDFRKTCGEEDKHNVFSPTRA